MDGSTGDVAEATRLAACYFKGRRKTSSSPAGMNVTLRTGKKPCERKPAFVIEVVIRLERDGNAEPCAVLLLNGSDGNPAAVIEGANRSLANIRKNTALVSWPEQDFPRTPTQKTDSSAHSRCGHKARTA